jgi:formate hydrogenlyase regulatory protein HycA
MAIPSVIPISYEPDYHTSSIGRYDDGQFFGSVTATLQAGTGGADDWFRYKRWYAVLHRFTDGGVHTGSDIWFAGTSEDEAVSVDRAEGRLAEWVAALPGHSFGDIAIGLFQVENDGHVFGLVDGSADYDGQDHAEFLPDTLGFDPPWDGSYDT